MKEAKPMSLRFAINVAKIFVDALIRVRIAKAEEAEA